MEKTSGSPEREPSEPGLATMESSPAQWGLEATSSEERETLSLLTVVVTEPAAECLGLGLELLYPSNNTELIRLMSSAAKMRMY